jgi:hypothetical protein
MRTHADTPRTAKPVCLLILAALQACCGLDLLASSAAAARVPILYSSDLYHPHEDPDDHFDLATLFCLPELDLQGILLDNAHRSHSQKTSPGEIPVKQMLRLTGRKVPYAIGLATRLSSPNDPGLAQPAEEQAAVAMMLDVLRRSPEKVVLMTTGSVRDVAAALNREPELLRAKVKCLYMAIGDPHCDEEYEYNVQLDPQAYVRVLQSGLPICWCPCFDGGLWKRGEYTTYWKFTQRDVLETAPVGLQNWFIFALTKPQGVDPIAFLTAPQEPAQRAAVWAMPRNMWTTIALLHAAGREIYQRRDGQFVARTPQQAADEGLADGRIDLVRFEPVALRVVANEGGKLRLATDFQTPSSHLRISHITDPRYEQIMTDCLRDLFRR